MQLKDIYSITGKPGLYRVVSQGRGRMIVEHLESKRRLPVSVYTQVSNLADTAMYTQGGEAPLPEVFQSMLPLHGEIESLDVKNDTQGVEALFARALPNYDRERVHLSHMQKALRWYLTLRAAGMEEFLPAKEADDETASGEAAEKA